MIATILHSSPTFNAVYYNEKKVAEGVASLIEIKDFGRYEKFGYSSPDDLVGYLKDYSSRNSRIKKAQFHIAFSCKGKEMTTEELLDFAHRYLDEMGYGQPGQPTLVYAHHDTDNNHIHVITSRVAPDGRKINHSNERRRGQKVLEKLTQQNVHSKVKSDITAALGFRFSSITQFKAVLEAMQYECYEKDNRIYVKKGGMVQDSIDTEIVNTAIRKNLLYADYKNKERYSQLRAIFRKYKSLNSSRAGLEKDLHKKFGLKLVFFGSKDSPYGYAVVDFNNKSVLEGGRIMKVQDLLSFLTPEEHRNRVESLIDR
ncbi:MAG: relaxase/mobilization nuclease domain-containing protein, partial [Muribaculaceae bacterium]|nr:relaxase/mobilization nuclease domain-containing protein [Muribaculaceae bacterium]